MYPFAGNVYEYICIKYDNYICQWIDTYKENIYT